jgi:hypothetical protein
VVASSRQELLDALAKAGSGGGAVVGAELSALTGGLVILLIVFLMVAGFPNIRKYNLTARRPGSIDS